MNEHLKWIFDRQDNEIFFTNGKEAKIKKIKEVIQDCELGRDREYTYGYKLNVEIYNRRIKTLKARLRREAPGRYIVLPIVGIGALVAGAAAITGIYLIKR